MGSPFAAAVQDAAVVVSDTFGTRYQLLPKVRGADVNAPVVTDPSRASVPFLATLHTPKAKVLMADAYDVRTNRRPGVSSQHPLLRIQPDQIAAPLGTAAAGPLVVAAQDCVLDQDTGVTWRVAAARTTTWGVVECDLQVVG